MKSKGTYSNKSNGQDKKAPIFEDLFNQKKNERDLASR